MTAPQAKVFWAVAGAILLLGLGYWAGRQAWSERSGGLVVQKTGVKYGPNRLADEKSPYLLQHAHNPVDWYPWGEEAFEKARKQKKPIFLSVGYSTCHWCHVMERESFENPEIAKVMNDNFVNIKVDREERPDVDRVYMTFVQATTGSGGWPMSVWLTPELKPFYGGTYYPPEDRWGVPGFKSVLTKIAEAWKKDPERVQASGDSIIKQLQEYAATAAGREAGTLEKGLLDMGFDQIASSYDPKEGGFGRAPKFPRPVTLSFLLRYYARTGNKQALDMSLHTLRKMADGGMHDHLGGGFHRYSVDDRWHIPHFEKMLYDQAQLVWAYLDAYQITGDQFYAETARDILDYVLRDMTGKDGQFYSAEDADSAIPRLVSDSAERAESPDKHAEGAIYVWEKKEIDGLLGKPAAELFNYRYGVESGGNVASDPHGEFPDKNVLIVSHTVEETARKFDRSPAEIRKILAEARKTLFEARAGRPRPHLDDKAITAWNGLMISAFARAYQVLDDPVYLAAAEKAAKFIKAKLYNSKTDTLIRRYRDGEAALDGYLDDYAYLIQGLLDLYEASFDVSYLEWAIALQKKQDELFWDAKGGGFFSTTGEDSSILIRMKNDYDGAEPSPNSVTAMNLLRLWQLTDDDGFRGMAKKTLDVFGGQMRDAPSALPQMLATLDFFLGKPKQIVIAGKPGAKDTQAMLKAVRGKFIPNKIVILADGGDGQKTLARRLEFLSDLGMIDGKATAYVCENYVCQLPTNDVSTMMKLVEGKKPASSQQKGKRK